MATDNDIVPYGERLLVMVDPKPERLGRIYVPEVNADRGNSGEIVAGPPGREHWLGRRAIFKPFSGTAVDISGQEAVLLMPDDILGFVNAPRPTEEDFDDPA